MNSRARIRESKQENYYDSERSPINALISDKGEKRNSLKPNFRKGRAEEKAGGRE